MQHQLKPTSKRHSSSGQECQEWEWTDSVVVLMAGTWIKATTSQWREKSSQSTMPLRARARANVFRSASGGFLVTAAVLHHAHPQPQPRRQPPPPQPQVCWSYLELCDFNFCDFSYTKQRPLRKPQHHQLKNQTQQHLEGNSATFHRWTIINFILF